MKSLLGTCEEATEAFQDTCSFGYDDLYGTNMMVASMSPPTQGDAKTRTAKGGRNDILMGRACVVFAYTYWEEYLRRQIGIAKGVLEPAITATDIIDLILKEHVKCDFWGDMGQPRQSILHTNGIASSKISCKQLKWFKP